MRNGKWHIINYFRDFVNNDSVETIKLAINPAAVYQSTINEIDLFFLCAEGIRFSDSSSFHINQSFSIVDAVENENDNSLKGLDKMYVAFFNGKNGDNSFAFPLVSVGDDIYGIVNYDVGYNFRLSLSLQNNSEYTLGYILNSIAKYNSKIEYTFYFIDSNLPDLNQIFIINGKKYIAKEFQQEFKVNMQSSVIKGVFYEYVD